MELDTIQGRVRAGLFNITDHAILEAFKDGVDVEDILHVISGGMVVETYPERRRMLVLGKTREKRMLHVVVDYSEDEPEIITAYIPDPKLWIKGRSRR